MKLHRRIDGSSWSTELRCYWLSWKVIGRFALVLDLSEDNCCDMQGAIKVAKILMPKVIVIITKSGGDIDTVYYKMWNEKRERWRVLDYNKQQMMEERSVKNEREQLPLRQIPDDSRY